MHFGNQNLLSIIHQLLDTQHVTAAFFKHYARSSETRSFKNYFRHMREPTSFCPLGLFATYMRKRPHYSFNRYITLHRRKKNPILRNFTSQIKTTILSTLQNFRIYPSSLKPHASGLFIQNKPNLKTTKIALSDSHNKTSAYCLTPSASKTNPIQSQFCNSRESKADERLKDPCFSGRIRDNTDKFSEIKEQKKYVRI